MSWIPAPEGRPEIAWAKVAPVVFEPQERRRKKSPSPGGAAYFPERARPAVCRPSGAWGVVGALTWGSKTHPRLSQIAPPGLGSSSPNGSRLRWSSSGRGAAGLRPLPFRITSARGGTDLRTSPLGGFYSVPHLDPTPPASNGHRRGHKTPNGDCPPLRAFADLLPWGRSAVSRPSAIQTSARGYPQPDGALNRKNPHDSRKDHKWLVFSCDYHFTGKVFVFPIY